MLQDILIPALSVFWLVLLWCQFWKPSRPAPMASYNFSAKTPIRQGRTTVLEFTAPSPPHRNKTVVPTILRVLDALNIVEARARSYSPHQHVAHELGLFNRATLRDGKSPGILKSETDTQSPPPLRFSSPGKRDVLRIEPIPTRCASAGEGTPRSTPSIARVTRSTSRSSIPAVQNSFAEDSEHEHDFRSDVHSTRSPSPATIRRAPSKHVGTRVAFELPYVERQLKPTPWFGSEGAVKIVRPPALQNQHEVRNGDVFYHKTPTSIQLWLWEGDDDGPAWRAVRMGHPGPGDRYLSITEKKLEPSWVCLEWCTKRISALKRQGLLD